MIKHVFVVFLIFVAMAASIQAQGLPLRRTLGNRLERPSAVDSTNVSATNEWDKVLQEGREFWKSWPNKFDVTTDQIRAVYAASEQRHNCIYIGSIWWPTKKLGECVRIEFTNSWHRTSGKSCIILPSAHLIDTGKARLCNIFTLSPMPHRADYQSVFHNAIVSTFPQKMDAEGRVVWIATSGRRDIEELEWVDSEIERTLDNERAKWASARGMTLEKAKERRAKWGEIETINERLRVEKEINSLKMKKIEKRAATQDELLVIQEEVKRLHAAKAAAEKEVR